MYYIVYGIDRAASSASNAQPSNAPQVLFAQCLQISLEFIRFVAEEGRLTNEDEFILSEASVFCILNLERHHTRYIFRLQ